MYITWLLPTEAGQGGGWMPGRAGCSGRGAGALGAPSPKVFGTRPHPAAPRTRPRGVEHPEAMRFKRGGRGRVTAAVAWPAPSLGRLPWGQQCRGPTSHRGPPRQGLRLRQLPPLLASGTLQGQTASWLLRHRPSVGREMRRVHGSVLGRSRHPPTGGQGTAVASAFRPLWHF